MSEPMKEDLSEDFWQSFQQPRENSLFTQGDSCFALVVRDRVWKEGRKSWRVEMERGSRIWERYVHFLLFSLCYRSTRPQWRPGWGSGRSTCRTGAGRTCRPSPTPLCSGCPASRATPGSAATWPSRRPADWKHKPASTRWTAACVNDQVGSPNESKPNEEDGLWSLYLKQKIWGVYENSPEYTATKHV